MAVRCPQNPKRVARRKHPACQPPHHSGLCEECVSLTFHSTLMVRRKGTAATYAKLYTIHPSQPSGLTLMGGPDGWPGWETQVGDQEPR
jgi:hypothetical protein